MVVPATPSHQADFKFLEHTHTISCHGHWTLDYVADLEFPLQTLSLPSNSMPLIVDGNTLEAMDTAGAWLLHRTCQDWEQTGQQVQLQGFKPEHHVLLEMVAHHTSQELPLTPPRKPGALEMLGRDTYSHFVQMVDFLAFIGETTLVCLHAFKSPSHIRWQALFANLQQSGLNALPIVGLLSFLMGVVLAYQGGEQLRVYGANIFIVDLVGITLLRELAPLLTAIIVAGRSGSAYTAQIGTMRVTDEIDALRTLGISPMELLVLPKLLALMIALPLLSVFADLAGIVGGMLIASVALDVRASDFLDRLPQAVALTHYLIGIGKAPIFAAAIALVGCYQGFQVKGGADSVGKQVTISVVQSIFLVIIVDACFSVLFSWLGI